MYVKPGSDTYLTLCFHVGFRCEFVWNISISNDDKPTPQTEENVNTNYEGMYLQVNITDNFIGANEPVVSNQRLWN
jgi:hypothetical protein